MVLSSECMGAPCLVLIQITNLKKIYFIQSRITKHKLGSIKESMLILCEITVSLKFMFEIYNEYLQKKWCLRFNMKCQKHGKQGTVEKKNSKLLTIVEIKWVRYMGVYWTVLLAFIYVCKHYPIKKFYFSFTFVLFQV